VGRGSRGEGRGRKNGRKEGNPVHPCTSFKKKNKSFE
jgi:hypothetical protein